MSPTPQRESGADPTMGPLPAEAILAASLDAVVAMDAGGVITGWSGRAEQIFGWTAAEAVGQEVAELIVPPSYRDAHRAGIERYRTMGDGPLVGRIRDLPGLRRGGEEFPAELSISAVSGSRSSAGFIAFIRDITDHKRAEQELRCARETAEVASQAKSEFLSRVSHELRTPLTAILGFSELIALAGGLPDRVRDQNAKVIRAGEHLLSLIGDVLDIARSEGGELTLSPEVMRVRSVIWETLEIVQPAADAAAVVLPTRLPRTVPEHYVLADRNRLKQVLLNLLSNAIKYNQPGGTVSIAISSEAERVRINVTDTGLGIAPDSLPRLFAPFERLDVAATDIPGTGLGLSLSKTLVEAMGGTIEVKSRLGSGSTFTVELPRAVGRVVGDVEDADDDENEVNSARTYKHARTVLYVEDMVSNLEVVEEILELRGDVRLISVMQGVLALDLARAHRPDLILLDIHLPDIDGHEVLRRLRKDSSTRDIPVVILSADVTDPQIKRMLEGGARMYLTKPIKVRPFLDMLDSFLNGNHDLSSAAEVRGVAMNAMAGTVPTHAD